MKAKLLITVSLMAASALFAADAGPKDAVLAAAKVLGEKPNYSWKSTVVVPESAQFKPGPTEGKTEKDGFTHVTMSFGDNATEGVMKGDKAAITDQDGNWKLASELEGAEGPARFLGRMVRNLKTPATQAAELVAVTKELKKDGDAYSGELTEAGAKAQFRFGNASGAKGSVKFWLKDGVLSKFEHKVTGKVDFNGNEMDVDRATTTEISNVGATKVNVPAEAKKKLG